MTATYHDRLWNVPEPCPHILSPTHDRATCRSAGCRAVRQANDLWPKVARWAESLDDDERFDAVSSIIESLVMMYVERDERVELFEQIMSPAEAEEVARG